jgi:hypothetical protein
MHGAREAQALREHLSDLTQGDHVRLAATGGLREPPRDLHRSHRGRAIRIRERADDAGQNLALRAEQDRPEVGRQVTPEDLGDDLGVRGAAAVGERASRVGQGRGVCSRRQ